jgi:acyl-coenzyme A thioesterase PaaI-like protein
MTRAVDDAFCAFSLVYLRPARLRETYAQCTLTRQGRLIANVTVAVWQEQVEQPNNFAREHFLLPEFI